MTIEHSDIGVGEIHEPKGITTAAAGSIYVANGSSSGSWKYSPLGFGYYQDNASAQTITTTEAKLSINGLGALTSEAYLPHEIRGSASLWDVVADKITPVRVGDAYDMRIDLPITAKSGSPTELTLDFDIGGAASSSIVILSRYMTTGKATPYTMTVGFSILALTALTITNGIQIFASTDTGTLDITAPSISLVKNVDGLF